MLTIIAIITIIMTISVIVYLKMTKMSPVDIAKAKIELLMTADIEEKQIFAIYGYTSQELTGEISNLNVLLEKKLLEIHNEFGITVIPPIQLEDIRNLDIDNLKFVWIQCDKTNSFSECQGEYVGRDKFDLGL